jgi:diguanylate cyclase (GGDEF)-like protein
MAGPAERGKSGRPGSDGTETDDLDLASLREGGLTQSYQTDTSPNEAAAPVVPRFEANIILIAHPEGRRLGSRFRLSPGSSLLLGRNPDAAISLPEVLSISRDHAKLEHRGEHVVLIDLGSTNGTYVNGQALTGPAVLESGDRFQVAGVHFKFLHEEDVEHAYYEAIYDLLMRDGLTEVFNKRKYLEEAEREVARALRHHRPLCLIMFDLDDFKLINDNFGHLCGDFVLKRVAALARELLRPEQLLARVGGDEFVILAPETPLEGGQALARKLCDRIAELTHTCSGTPVEVSCSFGVAALDELMNGAEGLYEAADRVLFRSKRDGRNRVTAFEREVGEP